MSISLTTTRFNNKMAQSNDVERDAYNKVVAQLTILPSLYEETTIQIMAKQGIPFDLMEFITHSGTTGMRDSYWSTILSATEYTQGRSVLGGAYVHEDHERATGLFADHTGEGWLSDDDDLDMDPEDQYNY